jgi:hypothetical protein
VQGQIGVLPRIGVPTRSQAASGWRTESSNLISELPGCSSV